MAYKPLFLGGDAFDSIIHMRRKRGLQR